MGSARNLELKVRCDEQFLSIARERAEKMGVAPFADLLQIDTYFAVTGGRLKLRELEVRGGTCSVELIAYERADHVGSRWSNYYRVPLGIETAIAVKAALTASPGIFVTVRKRRQAGIWRQTRIHLDRVEGLGEFIELETLLVEGGIESEARVEHEQAIRELGLACWPVVAGSYSDLVAGQYGQRQAAVE